MAMRSAWENSAPTRPIARRNLRTGLPLGSFASDGRRASTRKSICWSGDWPGAVCWNTASDAAQRQRTRSSSNRRLPDYWPRRRSSATQEAIVLSRFAYLRRRGNEMVLESAPRRRPVQDLRSEGREPRSPCCRHRSRSRNSVGRTAFRATELLGFAGRLPNAFQDRRGRRRWPPTDRGRRQSRSLGLPRSSVPHPQHRRPTRQPARRGLSICGSDTSAAGGAAPLAWKENRSAQVRRPAIRRRSRRSQSSCGNVIRRATSMTGNRSRSPSCHNFSTPRHACNRNGPEQISKPALPVVQYAVQAVSVGRQPYELELYLAVDNCDGLAARVLSLRRRRGTRWCRSAYPRHELEAQLAAAEFAMDAPELPQILITIAARFGRISWKYSSIAYSLILKTSAY